MKTGGAPKDTSEGGATDLKAVRRRRRPKPQRPSGAAENLWLVLRERFKTERAIKLSLKDWFNRQGRAWRPIGAFLSGREEDLPHVDAELLPVYLKKVTGKDYSSWEFVNTPGIPNFPAIFSANTPGSDVLLRGIRGTYQVIRRDADKLRPRDVYEFDQENDDQNILDIDFKMLLQPSVFRYETFRNESGTRELVGAWDGYALATPPLIYLVGFCSEAEDVAYMVLRQHAAASRVLVGVQSLLLPVPQKGPKHAVTRRMAAIPHAGTTLAAKDLDIAHRWINEGDECGFGSAVRLDFESRKS